MAQNVAFTYSIWRRLKNNQRLFFLQKNVHIPEHLNDNVIRFRTLCIFFYNFPKYFVNNQFFLGKKFEKWEICFWMILRTLLIFWDEQPYMTTFGGRLREGGNRGCISLSRTGNRFVFSISYYPWLIRFYYERVSVPYFIE